MEWTKRAPSAQRTQHATVGGNPLPNNSRCVLTPAVKTHSLFPRALHSNKRRKSKYSMDHLGARREDAQYERAVLWYGSVRCGLHVAWGWAKALSFVRLSFSRAARPDRAHFSHALYLAMTASAAAAPPATAAPSHLSKTNTDTLCCDPAEGFIRRFVYRVNLWSGAYMLERHERICLYSAVGLFFVSSCLYTLLFASGFVDGWKDSSAAFVLLSD